MLKDVPASFQYHRQKRIKLLIYCSYICQAGKKTAAETKDDHQPQTVGGCWMEWCNHTYHLESLWLKTLADKSSWTRSYSGQWSCLDKRSRRLMRIQWERINCNLVRLWSANVHVCMRCWAKHSSLSTATYGYYCSFRWRIYHNWKRAGRLYAVSESSSSGTKQSNASTVTKTPWTKEKMRRDRLWGKWRESRTIRKKICELKRTYNGFISLIWAYGRVERNCLQKRSGSAGDGN